MSRVERTQYSMFIFPRGLEINYNAYIYSLLIYFLCVGSGYVCVCVVKVVYVAGVYEVKRKDGTGKFLGRV